MRFPPIYHYCVGMAALGHVVNLDQHRGYCPATLPRPVPLINGGWQKFLVRLRPTFQHHRAAMPRLFRHGSARLYANAATVVLLLFCQILSASIELPRQPGQGSLHYADLIAAVAKYDELIVWEGLPSDFEHDSRVHESVTKQNFPIGDQLFYTRPLPFITGDKKFLSRAVLETKGNFRAWSGLKFCGGFHADYALEWRYKGQTLAQALICFSCHEVQFRVGSRAEQVDFSENGYKIFHSLLASHRQERPPFGLRSTPLKPPAPKPQAPDLKFPSPPPIDVPRPTVNF